MPNSDQTTWDALFHYYQSYSGEQEVFIVDLGTGEQKTRWFNSEREDGTQTMVSPFGAWYAHGKLFWPGTTAGTMAWYDPDLNDIFLRLAAWMVQARHAKSLLCAATG